MATKKRAQKASRAAKAQHGSKTAFVLGLPHDLSAKDVVAKGKAQGIKLSTAHVYKIRSSAKSPAPAKPTEKASEPSAVRTSATNKAGFVRGLPPGTSYADAAARAKAAGFSLSKAYFYTLKSTAKRADAPPLGKPGREPRPLISAPSAVAGGSTTGSKLVLDALMATKASLEAQLAEVNAGIAYFSKR
jgi:hypothetical protein